MLPLLLSLIICCNIEATNQQLNDDALHFSKSNEGPRIDRHSFFKQHFRLGYKLSLFCQAYGTPRPDMKWYKDGVEINIRPGLQIRNIIRQDTISSHLDVDPTRVLDAGEYECVANNTYGYHLGHMHALLRL
ncbi:unnamed protein product [Cylicocyclus nassatus]|uniref:Ig-like domain-containing protein n=1 Tax=Cylicocyclus nassatus TaxID=53992 RepID=A0AA36M6G9_CYLNA|nr:unnamed protein product [Cylicocyclus nassatus]CAJ0599501.1 unnamed protein product [Cylicocyclus nassatus]